MNVTFDEGPLYAPSVAPSGISGFLIRRHIVKNLRGAQILMLILSVMILIAAGFISASSMKHEELNTHKNFVPALPR